MKSWVVSRLQRTVREECVFRVCVVWEICTCVVQCWVRDSQKPVLRVCTHPALSLICVCVYACISVRGYMDIYIYLYERECGLCETLSSYIFLVGVCISCLLPLFLFLSRTLFLSLFLSLSLSLTHTHTLSLSLALNLSLIPPSWVCVCKDQSLWANIYIYIYIYICCV